MVSSHTVFTNFLIAFGQQDKIFLFGESIALSDMIAEKRRKMIGSQNVLHMIFGSVTDRGDT